MSKIKRGLLTFAKISLLLALICALVLTGTFFYFLRHVDGEGDERLFAAAGHGGTLKIYAEGASEDAPVLYDTVTLGAEHKEWVDLSDVSPLLRSAYLSAEDRDFYRHRGVNVRRTFAAALNSVFHFRSTFGASTVTQQVIKNISGDREVTFRRKFNEILRAVRLEQYHTKDEILEMYLNIVPMGDGIVGVQAASTEYFGKDASDLTLPEAATLAGISNAPALYHPRKNREACEKKRNAVLAGMFSAGEITEEEYASALAVPLATVPPSGVRTHVYSWFTETLLRDLKNKIKEEYGYSDEAAEMFLRSGDFRVYATVDPVAQGILEDVFSDPELLPALHDGFSYAMVVTDSMSADLRAVIGAPGEKKANRIDNHALIPHTPGSSLKPLALYAPLLDEKRINAATLFDDVPLQVSGEGEHAVAYPKNSPEVYDGRICVADALRLSKNTVACRMYGMLGAEKIYDSLTESFGFTTLSRGEDTSHGRVTDLAMAPLALGQLSYGVPLRTLTESYTVFAAGGVLHGGRSFTRLCDGDGNVLIENRQTERRVFSPETAGIMNACLSAVTSSGTASGVRLKYLVDTAGKTGTSGADKDRVFVGYTPYYTAGIWCGYPSGGGAVGKRDPSHLELWDRAMIALHRAAGVGQTEEPRCFSTAGLVRAEFCPDSGQGLSPLCELDLRGERRRVGWFTPDNMPEGICSVHVGVLYDAERECPADEESDPGDCTLVSMLAPKEREIAESIRVRDRAYFAPRRREWLFFDVFP